MEENVNTVVKNKQQRNSAFEILRIIAIIFIIAHHFAVHGGFDFSLFDNTGLILANTYWIRFIEQLGKVGVNLFVLISAFFLVDSSRFRIKKIFAILIEMLLFSILIGLIFYFVYSKDFSISLLVRFFFPVGNETWWFMTYYLIMYFLSPFLNKGIKAMNKKMHLIIIIVLLTTWSILSTFLQLNYGYSIFGWFFVLYLVGAYVRLYDVSLKMRPFFGILLSVGIFVLWYSLRIGLDLIFQGENNAVNGIFSWFSLVSMNNVVQVASTIVLFVSFKDIKMKNINCINTIASTTLTIYLIHDHPDIRALLWNDLFKNSSYASSSFLIPYSIGVILLVFIGGVIIGLLYKYTMGRIVDRILDWLNKKYLFKVDEIFNDGRST